MHHFDSLWRRFALLLLAVTLTTLVAPARAQLNPNGGSATGALDPNNTVAVYSYTLTTDSDATLTLTNDSTLNAYVYLYDSDGTTSINYTYVSAGATGTLTIPHLAPGTTYFVHIVRYTGAGSYTVSSALTHPAVANDAEPNDTPAQGHAFAANGSVTGHLGYSRTSYNDTDTVDWYKFTVPKDGDVTFSLTNDSTLNAYVEFYDSDGTTQLSYTYVSAGTSGNLFVPHLAPGATYYVAVARYTGYGGYTVSNTFTPQPIANDAEVNDAPAQAINLHGLSGFTGHLGYSRTSYNDIDTIDWYAVTVPQDGNVIFTLTNDSTLNAYIYCFDSDGASQINNTYVSAGTTGTLTIPHLAPGTTYYVAIARYTGYGGYTVTASLNPPSVDNDTEPNDAPAQAQPFDIDSTVTGHLGYSRTAYNDIDTIDWYSYVAPRDGDVTFTLTNDNTLNAYVYFFNSDGASQINNTYVSAGTTGTLTIPHLAPGATYYVAIARYNGYGGYTLSNGFAPLFVPNDAEVNDAVAQAVPLTVINNIAGHLGYSRTAYNDIDNSDWYAVNLPAGPFSVSMSNSSLLNAYLYLVAPDGATTLTYVYNGGGNVQMNYNIPTAGTYYLLVNRYNGYGAYDLNQPVTATISGIIALEGIVPGAPAQNITVEFRPANGTPFIRTASVGYNGTYFIQNVPRDKYTLAFKGAKWLRKVVQNVDVTIGDASGVNVLLPAGDADNNNIVDIADFGILVNVYGDAYDPTNPNAAPPSDVAADFNCDGVVDIGDFGLMVNNYGQHGDR